MELQKYLMANEVHYKHKLIILIILAFNSKEDGQVSLMQLEKTYFKEHQVAKTTYPDKAPKIISTISAKIRQPRHQ